MPITIKDRARARRAPAWAFTLVELVGVLIVFGLLAVIAVPTFKRVQENTVVGLAGTMLESVRRNGEAIGISDQALNDTQIASAAAADFPVTGDVTVSSSGPVVTLSVTRGAVTASGTVTFLNRKGTVAPPSVSVGLAYAVTAFNVAGSSEELSPTVTGGTAQTFAVTSGTVPTAAGVSFDTTTGVFTGPATWGTSVTGIAASPSSHGCAVTSGGAAKCWGYNSDGQLGDGTTTTRLTPVTVSGLTSNVTQITIGNGMGCAVGAAAAKCWGRNDNGQLGDGTTVNSLTPVTVSGLGSGVSQIATHNGHTCALTTAGGVKCWGFNNTYQLGDGTRTQRNSPIDVTGLTAGVAQIAVGGDFTCALTTAGGVKCWGSNDAGQLGDGSGAQRYGPVNVSGLTSGVAQIAAGAAHACAVTTSGGAKCWGQGGAGKIGDGTNLSRFAPVDVSGLTSGVASISAGLNHTCAALQDGTAKCWGRNWYGELGDGTTTDTLVPVDVSGLTSGVTSISAGYWLTCAIVSGAAKCWGYNYAGGLGNGGTSSSTTPVNVTGLAGTPGLPVVLTVTVTATDGRTGVVTFTLDIN